MLIVFVFLKKRGGGGRLDILYIDNVIYLDTVTCVVKGGGWGEEISDNFM